MIRTITVINDAGEELELDLWRPEQSGFYVKSVSGVGPGTSSINVVDSGSSDGAIFNSARLPKRNIVMSIGYLSTPGKDTVEELRILSYKYFQLKKKIKLVFETDVRTLSIEGYIEKNDPEIWSEKETVAISIICPYPYFKDEFTSIYYFYGIEPMFEFIFSNESLTENLIEFGSITKRESRTLLYEGDDDIGVVFDCTFSREVKGLVLWNTTSRESITVDDEQIKSLTGSYFKKGDELIISTVVGDKHATLIRDGVRHNVLNSLGRNVKWLKIHKGRNTFAYTTTENKDGVIIVISCDTIYEGI